METEEIFYRLVQPGLEASLDLGVGEVAFLRQDLAEILGQIRHVIKGRGALLKPGEQLLGAIGGLSELRQQLLQLRQGHRPVIVSGHRRHVLSIQA